MADSYVQVPPDSTGKQIDVTSLDVGVNTVMRQRIVIADNVGTATFATILSSGPVGTEGGLVVRNIPSGTQTIAGTIDKISAAVALAAGSANIGFINNISAVVAVSGTVSLGAGTANIGTINNISAAVVLAAGSNNIGTINNISATVAVTGTVSLGAGTANIGTINNISAAVVLAAGTANIGTINNISAAVVLAAGSNNIGTINNISATVAVTGTVSLGAGTANIGTINNISAAVVLAAGSNNIGTINNISAAVVLAAGSNNIGTINNISAAVVLAAGAANIGIINNISAAANVLIGLSTPAAGSNAATKAIWGDKYGRTVIVNNHPCLLPTASHGPRCTTLSTSATVALVAAPGAGLSVFVTMLSCTNGSATLTRGDVYGASATASCVAQMYMAANGGGFVIQYDPPIQLLSNTALNARVKPNVSQCIYNVHFYVGAK